MIGKDVLVKNALLEKAVALKRLEYSPLGKELKAQTRAAESSIKNQTKLFNLIKRKEEL